MAALLSAGVTRDPPEPVAPESPDTPSSAASSLTDGLTFADNGVPAQTTAPTSSKGYTVVNGVYLKNSSGTELDADALSDGSFAAQLTDDGPQVLIVHSHGSEAYTMPAGQEYTPTGSFRTDNDACNVVRVGDEIAAALSERGISVLHDRTLHDVPDYNDAYPHSLASVEDYMEKYPSLVFVLDVHRDAVSRRRRQQLQAGQRRGAPRRPDEFYYGQRLRRLAGESEAGHSHSAEPQRRLSYPHAAHYDAELPL